MTSYTWLKGKMPYDQSDLQRTAPTLLSNAHPWPRKQNPSTPLLLQVSSVTISAHLRIYPIVSIALHLVRKQTGWWSIVVSMADLNDALLLLWDKISASEFLVDTEAEVKSPPSPWATHVHTARCLTHGSQWKHERNLWSAYHPTIFCIKAI